MKLTGPDLFSIIVLFAYPVAIIQASLRIRAILAGPQKVGTGRRLASLLVTFATLVFVVGDYLIVADFAASRPYVGLAGLLRLLIDVIVVSCEFLLLYEAAAVTTMERLASHSLILALIHCVLAVWYALLHTELADAPSIMPQVVRCMTYSVGAVLIRKMAVSSATQFVAARIFIIAAVGFSAAQLYFMCHRIWFIVIKQTGVPLAFAYLDSALLVVVSLILTALLLRE
jgi:hypothetical protein